VRLLRRGMTQEQVMMVAQAERTRLAAR
jgi:hypothetical protein